MFESMKIRYFLLASLIVLLITMFCTLFIFDIHPEDNESVFTLVFSYSLLGLFPILWAKFQLKKQNKDLSDVVYIKNVTEYTQPILILTITLIFFSLGSFWLLGYILSFPFPSYVEFLLQDDALFPEHGFLFLLMAIYISLIGPIAEEFIFRGLLLKRLGKKFNMVMSIIVTNILFAILHGDFIGAFMFGFIVSLIYLKSGNLLLPIIVHILNNFIVTLLVIFDPPVPDFLNYINVAQLQEQVIPNLIILIVTTPILIIYIRKYIHVLANRKV